MFTIRMPSINDVPSSPVEQKAYDVAPGVDWRTAEEMGRIRGADAGAAMRQRALEGLPLMEGAATGRESAARAAAALAMSRANAQAAAVGAQGSPLAQRQALARQAALRASVAGQAAPAIATEQQKAQQAYIQAAQAQRAQDIRRAVGLEEIAQREMAMGLRSKWDTAQAQMEFEKEKLRKYGIDLGVWDAAQNLAMAREAAVMGAVGTGIGSAASLLGGLGQSSGGVSPETIAAAKSAYGYTGMDPNWSV